MTSPPHRPTPVPEHRAVLGVDIACSASAPENAMTQARHAMAAAVRTALDREAIPESDQTWADRGDGALVTVPGNRVATLLDVAHRVDGLMTRHNRLHTPVRLRLSVAIGPIPDGDTLSRTRVEASRLLDADAFKTLLTRCGTEGRATTALIVSDRVHSIAFEGDYTDLVDAEEFAPFPVEAKEHRDNAWVRVPGFDATHLARLAADIAAPRAETAPSVETGADSETDPSTQPGGGNESDAAAGTTAARGQVVNIVNGTANNVIQAHTIRGGLHFGS